MRLKRIFCSVLSLVFFTAVYPLFGQVEERVYKDVPRGHWAYDAVVELTEKGILEGYEEKSGYMFRGESTLTRYEFAHALARSIIEIEQNIIAEQGSLNIEDYLKSRNVSSEDMELLSMLVQEFKKELYELNIRTSKIERDMKRHGGSNIPLYVSIGSALVSLIALTVSLQK